MLRIIFYIILETFLFCILLFSVDEFHIPNSACEYASSQYPFKRKRIYLKLA